MQPRGTIYHHNRLVYSNGTTGKKFLILLNTPHKEEHYLFVRTTSQKKNKPSTPGCIKRHSAFFILANKAFFPLDAWVQLHDIFPFTPKDIDTDKDITIKGKLDVKMIEDIVNCLLEAEGDNIPPIWKNLLRPLLDDSLLKLQAKFNKNR